MNEELYIIDPHTFDVVTTRTGYILVDHFKDEPASLPLKASRMILFAETDSRHDAILMAEEFERDVLQPCIESEADGICHITATQVREFVDGYDRTRWEPLPTIDEMPPYREPDTGLDMGQIVM